MMRMQFYLLRAELGFLTLRENKQGHPEPQVFLLHIIRLMPGSLKNPE